MLKKGIFFLLFAFSFLDAGTLRLYDEAAETQSGLLHLRKGMTKEDVLYILGYPYQVQTEKAGNKCFEVWMYFYKKPSLSQRRILRRNLIPLIFYKNQLLGWGNKEYQHFIGVDSSAARRANEREPQYTNDKEEWPANEPGYIPSPREELRKKAQQQKAKPTIQTTEPTQTILPVKQGAPKSTTEPYPQGIVAPPTAGPSSGATMTPPPASSTEPAQQTQTGTAAPEGTGQEMPSMPSSTGPTQQVQTEMPTLGETGPEEPSSEEKGPESLYIHTQYSKEYRQAEEKYKERQKRLEEE